MGAILDDVQEATGWIAAALTSSGYEADFAPASLWEVDRFFDEQTKKPGKARRGGLLAENLGSRLFGLGCYVGEVIRRDVGGEWAGDDGDPEAEINVEVHLSDRSVIWPVQRAMKRFALGAEEGIAAYGSALGARVGPRP